MLELAERNATRADVKSDIDPVVQQPRLLDRVRDRIRVKHYSRSTEKTYVYWIRFFIHFHGLRHPQDMGAHEVDECDTASFDGMDFGHYANGEILEQAREVLK
jgi:hypothetical protein